MTAPTTGLDRDSALLARLAEMGVCDAEALARVRALARTESARADRVLLRLGLVEEGALVTALTRVCNLDRLDAARAEPDPAAVARLTNAYLVGRLAVPLAPAGPGGPQPIATADPLDSEALEEIGFLLDRAVTPVAATTSEVRALLARAAGTAPPREPGSAQVTKDTEELRRAEIDGPVIRFVQDTLADAVLAGASDLHFEATDESLRLRFRLKGVLVPQSVLPDLAPQSVVARLKVMAGLNVAERRLPQDGRLQAVIAGRRVDFRFSSLPTHLGESIAIRVLDPKSLRLGWASLGFPPDIVAWIEAILARPSGLFLVTGPTGSGKTTTLYAALAHLNTPGRKIITIEDPVEYNLPGMQQIQVQDEIGLSFARVLRGVLRHDPNVIMVGEIRDPETAEMAIRAAQVGRLVLSTLHTNGAGAAVSRLVDLGVPRFLIDDVLHGVLGQELRHVACEGCGGAGCEGCGGTGVARRELRVERWPAAGRGPNQGLTG